MNGSTNGSHIVVCSNCTCVACRRFSGRCICSRRTQHTCCCACFPSTTHSSSASIRSCWTGSTSTCGIVSTVTSPGAIGGSRAQPSPCCVGWEAYALVTRCPILIISIQTHARVSAGNKASITGPWTVGVCCPCTSVYCILWDIGTASTHLHAARWANNHIPRVIVLVIIGVHITAL